MATEPPRFVPHPAFAPHLAHRAPPAGQWPPLWAVAWGDDRYGLWAELEVTSPLSAPKVESTGAKSPDTATAFGTPTMQLLASTRVRQRLRWIEPGQFRMGSPPDEPERFDDEGPQHLVTLSQGFWLADTACSQALWLAAVGGDNPSDFKQTGDLQLPVELVSWNDVMQQFMPALAASLPPGWQGSLPSEAEWEYACRAGSSTPFNLGEQIDPSQVNYDGNHPYNGGLQGECRERTVPVGAFRPNAWGLFQMHGNVYEWCLDGRRTYEDAAAVDPLGAVGDGPRALRGGSWDDHAGGARSAYRYLYERDWRIRFIGFRLALRFKPGTGAGGAGGSGAA